MRPVLFEVFGEPVPAYFAMLALGYAVAIAIVYRWAGHVGIDRGSVLDAGLASVVGGIVGGRLLHVLADGYFWDYVHLCTDPARVGWKITQAQCAAIEGRWDAAAQLCRPVARDCLAWAKFYNGGLAYYGGLFVGTASAVYVARKDRLPILRVADVTAIGVAFALGLGRIGCFLGGCCYGSVSDSALALRFPAWSAASEGQFREGLLPSAGHVSLPVHPTQLYEAAGCFALGVLLAAWVYPRRRYDGAVALAFLVGYAVLRFGLEFLRADDRGALLGVSTSQWLGLAILVGAALAHVRLRGRGRERSS